MFPWFAHVSEMLSTNSNGFFSRQSSGVGWGGGPSAKNLSEEEVEGERGGETDREKVGNPKKFEITASRLCAGDLAGKKKFV